MRVLIACEFSGIVRDAFIARGHEAWSCDLLPSEGKPLGHWYPQHYPPGHPLEKRQQHHQCSVFDLFDGPIAHSMALEGQRVTWDLMIAFPPCTHLAVSGARWFRNKQTEQKAALAFVEQLWHAGVPRIAIENPVGILSRREILGKPTQIIQPYQFGEDASKKTCLWLKGLPPLLPTAFAQPRMVKGKPRWSNQTDSGQNRLTPSPTRGKDRARTYSGIANAMAEQWGRSQP